MANQPENPTPEHEPQRRPEAEQTDFTSDAKPKLLDRVPPRFRKKRWIIGGMVTAAALGLLLFQCGTVAIRAFATPEPEPEPVVQAATVTPAPAPLALSDRQSSLPDEYAFNHFVRELDECYQQKGIVLTLQETEADIMADVPYAVGYLLRHYADGVCQEQDEWRRIPDRLAWLLRVGDVQLPELPTAEPQQ